MSTTRNAVINTSTEYNCAVLSMTTVKQDIQISNYYDELKELPSRFKLKQVEELDNSDLHTLRCANVIEKVPNAMGKETVWELTQETELALERFTEEIISVIPDLTGEQILFLERHEERFATDFQEWTEDEFLARELDLKGRTPEGMDTHGFFNKAESRSGYATKWELSDTGKRICEYKELKETLQ